jgi:hypothetical protein
LLQHSLHPISAIWCHDAQSLLVKARPSWRAVHLSRSLVLIIPRPRPASLLRLALGGVCARPGPSPPAAPARPPSPAPAPRAGGPPPRTAAAPCWRTCGPALHCPPGGTYRPPSNGPPRCRRPHRTEPAAERGCQGRLHITIAVWTWAAERSRGVSSAELRLTGR